jgi:hypothetical protein
MSDLDDHLSAIIRKAVEPKTVIPLLIISRINRLGIALSQEQEDQIKQKYQDSIPDNFRVEFSEEQQDQLERSGVDLNNIVLDLGDVQLDTDAFKNIISGMTDNVSETLANSWIEHSTQILDDEYIDRQQFETGLRDMWGKPLRLLESLVGVCNQMGAQFNERFRPSAVEQHDIVFDALTRLHARGCQVALEVCILLKSGLADGAHARWRTLHEIAITAMFINKHGNDVAERYLYHSVISDYKEAQQYQQYCTLLGYEPLSAETFEQLRRNRNEAIRRYGRPFDTDNGWAADVLRNDWPRFTDLERDVNLNHLRPFYKLANMNVHAGSKSISYRLGLPPQRDNLLISGSSIFGIAEPGQNTAVSLQQLTVTLLLSKVNMDRLASAKAIQKLMNQTVWAFDEVMQSIREDNDKTDNDELA